MTTPASEETDPHADTASSRKATDIHFFMNSQDIFLLSIREFFIVSKVLCSNKFYVEAIKKTPVIYNLYSVMMTCQLRVVYV